MPVRIRTIHQRRTTFAIAVVGNVIPVVLAVLHQLKDDPRAVFLWGAALSVFAPFVVSMAPTRRRPLRWAAQYIGVVGLTMMQAYNGGPGSPYALLLVGPAIWFGVTLTGRELWAAHGVIAACCLLPMVVLGAPAYPVNWLAAMVLLMAITAVVGSLALLTRETDGLIARLSHVATHDRLTDLLNRRGWEEGTERSLQTARPGDPVCLVMIDLDGLKQINDSGGHDQGDRAIRETGNRLRTAFGSEEAVARLGGDEFVVLLLDSPVDQVLTRLDRLRQSTPAEGAFSAGVAVVAPGEEIGDAMRRADLALYEVKKTGRGRDLVASAPPDLGAYEATGAALPRPIAPILNSRQVDDLAACVAGPADHRGRLGSGDAPGTDGSGAV